MTPDARPSSLPIRGEQGCSVPPRESPAVPPIVTAPRALIVTGDDFGISSPVNHAIVRAHREGILTSASLMVNGPAFREAVELARGTPTLAVGLHLALSGSAPTLPRERIPLLVGKDGHFAESPSKAGLKYFFSPSARRELEGEIRAQLERFLSTGLPADHVDGHHHLHMHPVIFSILVRACADYGISAVRIVRERLRLSQSADPRRLLSRITHRAIFALLARSCDRKLGELPIRTADAVLGLLLDGQMTKEHLIVLLSSLPAGITEIYSHPSLDPDPVREGQALEFQALVAPEVKEVLRSRGIRLTCYRHAQRALLQDKNAQRAGLPRLIE